HARAATEGLLLLLREVKEAQRQRSGTITHATQQLPAPAIGHLGQLDVAFHDGLHTDAQRTDRRDAGTVFIARWQQKQQILNRVHPQSRELGGNRITNAAQRGDRGKEGAERWACSGNRMCHGLTIGCWPGVRATLSALTPTPTRNPFPRVRLWAA